MLTDWCNKLGCLLRNTIIKNVNIKQAKEEQEQKQEIKINNLNYEYVHGKLFSKPPTWIVIHYTACANVSAKQMCKSMRKNTTASTHFYVDENDIYASVPLNYVAWHVGNGQCKQPSSKKLTLEELSNYKCNDWRYDLAAKNHIKWKSDNDDFTGNSISIGVDMCVKKKSTSTLKATDLDWYFEDNTIENTAKLVAYLMNLYNINIDHVVRHCDCTGKLCPAPYTWPPEKGDSAWESFKNKVAEYMKCGVSASEISEI